MKLTKATLKRIIKEELNAVLNESDENVAKIIGYMKSGVEGFRSALQLADTMGLTQQALQGLMNELDPEKIANDYKQSVWSWPESIEEHLMDFAFDMDPGVTTRQSNSGDFTIYELDRSGEIYAYLLEEAQDGLLTDLSEIMNDADPRELASTLKSAGVLDMMTSKFMDLMLQGNEAAVSVTPEKIVLSDEKLDEIDWFS
jgi:hypothetical protein